MKHPYRPSDCQKSSNARAPGARWTRWVVMAIAVLGMVACGGDETPANNASNNTPNNNTSQQTVPNNPENNPPNNPECEPTASGIEICDGIDNDCDGVVDEGYDGLGEPCSVGEGACETSGTNVCGVDKISVVCDAELSQECFCQPQCSGETPVCDTETRTCTACVQDADCGDRFCLIGDSLSENRCEECFSNTHCTSPIASVCDLETNTCVGCAESVDCQHQNRQFCLTSAETDICYDCLPGNEEAEQCNGNVCFIHFDEAGFDGDVDPILRCTDVPINSVGLLERCNADSACVEGSCRRLAVTGGLSMHHCVIGGEFSYCPERVFPNFVERRFFESTIQVCEGKNSPEAVRELGKPCLLASAATDCPAPESMCAQNFEGVFVCTYPCDSELDCPEGVSCGAQSGAISYCLGTS